MRSSLAWRIRCRVKHVDMEVPAHPCYLSCILRKASHLRYFIGDQAHMLPLAQISGHFA